MTAEKLTRSLASVSATTAPRAALRPSGPDRRAIVQPSNAPRALAPQSPTMWRSSRSPGSSALAGPAARAAAIAAGVAASASGVATGAPSSYRVVRQRPRRRQLGEDFPWPAGPQVEQVDQVGGPTVEGGVEQPV